MTVSNLYVSAKTDGRITKFSPIFSFLISARYSVNNGLWTHSARYSAHHHWHNVKQNIGPILKMKKIGQNFVTFEQSLKLTEITLSIHENSNVDIRGMWHPQNVFKNQKSSPFRLSLLWDFHPGHSTHPSSNISFGRDGVITCPSESSMTNLNHNKDYKGTRCVAVYVFLCGRKT